MHSSTWPNPFLAAPPGPPPGGAQRTSTTGTTPARGDVVECRGCGLVFVWRRARGHGACARCGGTGVAKWRPE